MSEVPPFIANCNLLNLPGVTIISSKQSTGVGKHVCKKFMYQLFNPHANPFIVDAFAEL